MKLLERLGLIKRINYELPKDVYFTQHLSSSDSDSLKTFVSEFTQISPLPLAILAVGSSTFPKSHWEEIKQMNLKDYDLKAPEKYSDIDLLLVPEKKSSLFNLEEAVAIALRNKSIEFKRKAHTLAGVSYCDALSFDDKGNQEKIIAPWLNISYGLHSISTKLKNGTVLDLILGREDLLLQTAKERIAQERKDNNAFSLLYDPQFTNP